MLLLNHSATGPSNSAGAWNSDIRSLPLRRSRYPEAPIFDEQDEIERWLAVGPRATRRINRVRLHDLVSDGQGLIDGELDRGTAAFATTGHLGR